MAEAGFSEGLAIFLLSALRCLMAWAGTGRGWETCVLGRGGCDADIWMEGWNIEKGRLKP